MQVPWGGTRTTGKKEAKNKGGGKEKRKASGVGNHVKQLCAPRVVADQLHDGLQQLNSTSRPRVLHLPVACILPMPHAFAIFQPNVADISSAFLFACALRQV